MSELENILSNMGEFPDMTIKEAWEFLLNEVLSPFMESNLFDEYVQEYKSRVEGDSFENRYLVAQYILEEYISQMR